MDLVDSELRPRLDMWASRELNDESLLVARAGWSPLPYTPHENVTVEELEVPGPSGAPPVRLLLYRPAGIDSPVPIILHIHGGGYIMGSAAHFMASQSALVSTLGCASVSVDYRLAPETVFPGALEDCYAVLGWIFANADAYGFDLARIGVMGESAGGGLAAALALLARDRGEYRLAFQHLIAPMIDDRTGTVAPPSPLTGQFIWTAADNAYGWSSMLGHAPGMDGVSPYAAAARADNLENLPPAYIHVGALDLFLDENLSYAGRLVRAGVPVELHIWPGAYHGFDLAPESEIARRALGASRDALRRALTAPR